MYVVEDNLLLTMNCRKETEMFERHLQWRAAVGAGSYGQAREMILACFKYSS